MSDANTRADLREPSPIAVRLEALRLAHRFDRSPEQVTTDAEIYAEWVLKPTPRRGKSDKSAPAEPEGT